MRIKISRVTLYVLAPVVIGLSVVFWLFYDEFNIEMFSEVHFSKHLLIGIVFALVLIAGRDGGQMWRFRILSDRQLTWLQTLRVNLLCEFTSAVTPAAVGGSSLVVLFLNREGMAAGKGVALMMACLLLDELFLVLAYPLILLLVPFNKLFPPTEAFTLGMQILFGVAYIGIVLWTIILFYALFKKTYYIRKLLLKLFSFGFLKRWQGGVEQFTDNMIVSSKELSRRSFSFWLKAFAATCVSWISRYMVVVALLIAFTSSGEYLVAFARQLILWIFMLVTPTPGGSGVAEYMFNVYYADFFPVVGMSLVVAFVWRAITYYIYLVFGVLLFPNWLSDRRTLREETLQEEAFDRKQEEKVC